MGKKLSLYFLFLMITACSNDPVVENFKAGINPAKPPIIFADVPIFMPAPGDAPPVLIEITGPSMLAGFNFVNESRTVITIAVVSYEVTGPDGETRIGMLQPSQSLNLNTIFAEVRAEKDINCDGTVTDNENLSSGPLPPTPCSFDENNPSFNGELFYFSDLLTGVDEADRPDLRGGVFTFDMILEGWQGPANDPQENFFKRLRFTVQSNGG